MYIQIDLYLYVYISIYLYIYEKTHIYIEREREVKIHVCMYIKKCRFTCLVGGRAGSGVEFDSFYVIVFARGVYGHINRLTYINIQDNRRTKGEAGYVRIV